MSSNKPKSGRIGILVLLMLLAFWTGTYFRAEPKASAGVRSAAAPGHFLSGSERSLPILTEISTTLKQIDARLAKIEKVALASAKK